ncbi:thioredoxin reductase (NADPH) [Thermoflavimicrobium dichotomicum]|uniref:Thioredoxin reductase (NADPH) n=2 Tax=Thermoflavimicrobium dichotomicum TaxID=46223 RepID=A0A1I3SF08_9BACL|nr:YpdA family putative bacillithiol disulfide reductase [Thermoflavimicrobium dichotomicum]SFJ57384.1 thioredoxin reductase (NADPH) [Thermoflavimicrobium dichotomicum]
MEEAIIIGAGPCGISAAVELKKRGIEPLVIEKGCIANSIYHYPVGMTFFSSPENIEIGDVPFVTINEKPTRHEALKYYRKVVQLYDVKVHTYERVTQIQKADPGFLVYTETREGKKIYETPYVILSTGYYDQPNLLNIPGEDLPHVFHYFKDGHPYAGHEVVVIGGRNSAIDAALELYQAGANVTMVYRKASFHPSVKAWVKPVIEAAIEKERIRMIWETEVMEIKPRSVVIDTKGVRSEIPADFVFAMTGYRPDLTMAKELGAEIDPKTHVPICSEAMETTVPGLYLAGVIATGHDATKIFIENGRFHGQMIAEDIKQKLNQKQYTG